MITESDHILPFKKKDQRHTSALGARECAAVAKSEAWEAMATKEGFPLRVSYAFKPRSDLAGRLEDLSPASRVCAHSRTSRHSPANRFGWLADGFLVQLRLEQHSLALGRLRLKLQA